MSTGDVCVSASKMRDDGTFAPWCIRHHHWIEPGTPALSVLEAELQALREWRSKVRDDVRAGIAWWNGLSHASRAFWITHTGGGSAAQAWAAFRELRDGTDNTPCRE
jgi:hypothetical protein